MTDVEPAGELDQRYSSEGATTIAWADAHELLASADVYWLSTVRPGGRPHVTPLISVWLDGAPHFCAGRDERKTRNLARNPHCVLTTGRNALHGGLDVVVEGTASRADDAATLQLVADAFTSKYGWRFTVRDGVFVGDGGEALVWRLTPATAFAFSKGEPFGQTRWRF